jgi:hypothetical protein
MESEIFSPLSHLTPTFHKQTDLSNPILLGMSQKFGAAILLQTK